jgi:hypothetical protein
VKGLVDCCRVLASEGVTIARIITKSAGKISTRSHRCMEQGKGTI